MRQQLKVAVKDISHLKKQLLHWAANYNQVWYFDNNQYTNYQFQNYECVVAVGVRQQFSPKNENSFDSLFNFHKTINDWLFGYFTYDLKNEIEDLKSDNPDFINLPPIHFVQPEIVITLQNNELTIESFESPQTIFKEVFKQSIINDNQHHNVEVNSRFNRADYIKTIKAIKQHITKGDVYELNLCQEFYSENTDIDPVTSFQKLNKLTKAPFSAFVKTENTYIISASPERFLMKNGNQLISQPIKGTIKRGNNEEEDFKLQQQLKSDIKERAENIMIVDLVRNDLARSCIPGTVKVEELFGIYPFETVNHMISTITGTIISNVNWAKAIKNAFPMGSMTGAPKISAMQLIEQYEKTKRGLYSGSVGYIKPNGNFDFNVVIRSILYNANTKYLSYQVGGAITFDSIPEKEYDECLLKAQALNKVLNA